MYAIQNKATKKWLCGTDYRFYKPRQRTSYTEKLTYETKQDAENDMKSVDAMSIILLWRCKDG